jgi:hypothetical protein
MPGEALAKIAEEKRRLKELEAKLEAEKAEKEKAEKDSQDAARNAESKGKK